MFNANKSEWDVLAEQSNLFSKNSRLSGTQNTNSRTQQQQQQQQQSQQDSRPQNIDGLSSTSPGSIGFSFFDNSKLYANKNPLDYSVLSQTARFPNNEKFETRTHVNKEIEARKIFYNIFFWATFRLIKSTLLHIRFFEKLINDNIVIYFSLLGLDFLFGYNIVAGFVILSKFVPEELESKEKKSAIVDGASVTQQAESGAAPASQKASLKQPQPQQPQPQRPNELASIKPQLGSSAIPFSGSASSGAFGLAKTNNNSSIQVSGNTANLPNVTTKSSTSSLMSKFVPPAKYYYKMRAFGQAKGTAY